MALPEWGGEGEALDGTFAHGQGYDLECDPTEPSQHLTACSLLALCSRSFARSYWTIRVSGHLVRCHTRCQRQDIGLREESERTRTAEGPSNGGNSCRRLTQCNSALSRCGVVRLSHLSLHPVYYLNACV